MIGSPFLLLGWSGCVDDKDFGILFRLGHEFIWNLQISLALLGILNSLLGTMECSLANLCWFRWPSCFNIWKPSCWVNNKELCSYSQLQLGWHKLGFMYGDSDIIQYLATTSPLYAASDPSISCFSRPNSLGTAPSLLLRSSARQGRPWIGSWCWSRRWSIVRCSSLSLRSLFFAARHSGNRYWELAILIIFQVWTSLCSVHVWFRWPF